MFIGTLRATLPPLLTSASFILPALVGAASTHRSPAFFNRRLHSTGKDHHPLQPRLATMSTQKPLFFMDDFCLRQFNDDSYQGTRITGVTPDEFAAKINALCTSDADLKEGYAPFCKHVFVENFVGALCPVVPINDDTRPLIVSDYKARTPKELPVLTRWIPADKFEANEAKYLDVILYSREQIVEEAKAMNRTGDIPEAPWGIISVKAQDEPHETPMQPITMLRNALGKEEGGSGVPLDRKKYEESVAYWKAHVPLA